MVTAQLHKRDAGTKMFTRRGTGPTVSATSSPLRGVSDRRGCAVLYGEVIVPTAGHLDLPPSSPAASSRPDSFQERPETSAIRRRFESRRVTACLPRQGPRAALPRPLQGHHAFGDGL